MTATFQRQTARAMATQLTRVNDLDNPLVERLRAENAALQSQIAALREKLRLAELVQTESNDAAGRQWLTVEEFCQLKGVNQSTLSRALNGKTGNRVVGNVRHPKGTRWLIDRNAEVVYGRKARNRRKL